MKKFFLLNFTLVSVLMVCTISLRLESPYEICGKNYTTQQNTASQVDSIRKSHFAMCGKYSSRQIKENREDDSYLFTHIWSFLTLDSNMTFFEDRWNAQCFGQPLDASGKFYILNDTLVLQYTHTALVKDNRATPLSEKSHLVYYKISNDTLVCLADKNEIFLKKRDESK